MTTVPATESLFSEDQQLLRWNGLLDLEFHATLDRIDSFFKRQKIIASEKCLDRKTNFELFRKLEISKKFETLKLLQYQNSLNNQEFESSRDFEIRQLNGLLRKLNWKLVDSSILDLIKENEILEIYDGNAVQIYRSWNFFQYCSYSLMEILTHDWAQLYERPSDVVQKLWGIFPKFFTKELNTIKYRDFGIPTYLLIEKQMQSEMGFQFEMNLASPIVDSFGNTCAFISAGFVTPIPLERGNSASISFI